MIQPIFLSGLAYVVGATPTALWVGKVGYGVDLRREGSGNLGATNTYRVLGIRAALPVVVLDVAKGWAPVTFFPLVAPGAGVGWTIIYGAAAIIGHVFSFWVGFRGGKGVATSTGVFLALAPWAVLVGFAVWLTAILLTGYVSLGSVLGAIALVPAVLLIPHDERTGLALFAVGLAGFVVWSHRENLRRLARGEESRTRIGRKGGKER